MLRKTFVILLVLAIIVLTLNIFGTINTYAKPVGILALGLCIGFVLQRSRFCIASAYMDLILFRDGTLFKALIVFILVSTLGFVIPQLTGKEGFIVAIGWRTLAGGVLFGMGMVFAGGCAVGTLMRIGEGYVPFVIVLGGLMLGGAMGAYHYDIWGTPAAYFSPVYLPKLFGMVGSLLLQTVFLLIVWEKLHRWG